MAEWDAGEDTILVEKTSQAETFNFTFSTAPLVIATMAGATVTKGAGATNITTTGFDIYGEVAEAVHWIARESGYDSGAAAGPTITDAEDEVFTVYETNIVVTGTAFGTNTGSAKLELGDSATYASATKVTQTIDTWADTSIQFDLVIGALDVESLYLYVTDSGGTTSAAYAVTVGLTPTVTDVDTDEAIDSNQVNIVVTGDTFLNAQGTGKVELSDNSDYATGTKVTQSIDTWANGSIQFDAVIGSLTASTLYLWVTNDKGFRQAAGTVLTVTYPTITDAGDELYELNETDIIITGNAFGATQGTGKVELGNNAVYASATKVTQTIDSWGATSIQFDLVIGALTEIDLWLFVTDKDGTVSNAWPVQVYRTPTITNIEDEIFASGETGIILDGTYLQSPQGTGKLEISDNAVYAAGTKVAQTINSWNDTQINFDLELGAIGTQSMWMWVTNDLGRLSLGEAVTITGLPITDGLWTPQSFQASIGSSGLDTTVFMIRDE